jgi:hypothetical protein
MAGGGRLRVAGPEMGSLLCSFARHWDELDGVW